MEPLRPNQDSRAAFCLTCRLPLTPGQYGYVDGLAHHDIDTVTLDGEIGQERHRVAPVLRQRQMGARPSWS